MLFGECYHLSRKRQNREDMSEIQGDCEGRLSVTISTRYGPVSMNSKEKFAGRNRTCLKRKLHKVMWIRPDVPRIDLPSDHKCNMTSLRLVQRMSFIFTGGALSLRQLGGTRRCSFLASSKSETQRSITPKFALLPGSVPYP